MMYLSFGASSVVPVPRHDPVAALDVTRGEIDVQTITDDVTHDFVCVFPLALLDSVKAQTVSSAVLFLFFNVFFSSQTIDLS